MHSLLLLLYLLPRVSETKHLPTQMTYSGIDLIKKLYNSILNIFDENIVHIEQRFKKMGEFRFVELNPKLTKRKKNSIEAFSTLDVCKNILDLERLKCKLKPVYAAYFSMIFRNMN